MTIPQEYLNRCITFLQQKHEEDSSLCIDDELDKGNKTTDVISLAHIYHMIDLLYKFRKEFKHPNIYDLDCYITDWNFYEGRDNPYNPLDGLKLLGEITNCAGMDKDKEGSTVHYTGEDGDCCHKRFTWVISNEDITKFSSYNQGFSLDSTVDYVNKVLSYIRIN
jgi:hypothetical protein